MTALLTVILFFIVGGWRENNLPARIENAHGVFDEWPVRKDSKNGVELLWTD
jgi:hypothetical protein